MILKNDGLHLQRAIVSTGEHAPELKPKIMVPSHSH